MAIEKAPEGTYGTREPGKLGGALFEAFTQRSIAAYRRTGGAAARMMGFPVVLVLRTRGSISGQLRTGMVGGFPVKP
jgi:hypothetical protein